MVKGTKRGSPGAEDEKNPLQTIDVSEEDAAKLQGARSEVARVELALERTAQIKLTTAYEKRRPALRSIPKFWPAALMNHSLLAYHIQHNADQLALSHLEDVWVERDPREHRCYTIEFTFKENSYFTDRVLKKEYKYMPPPTAADEKPDEDGITRSMLEFSWERDVKISGQKINWKDPGQALTKLYPRQSGEEEDEDVVDPGSFFNFFEQDSDPSEIGITIACEIFPEAVDYFLGNAGEDLDSESDDDDDDDDDAEEIDLEKPRPKKQKV